MHTSVEVRWFAPGPPPEELERCFDVLGARSREVRHDAYLDLPGTAGLGVKLRNGGDRLEVKLRECEFEETKLPGGPPVRLERWEKWSFPVTPGGCTPATLGLPDGSWIEVEKARRLIRYGLGEDGSAVPVEEWPDDGCGLELTAVAAGGQVWWTLCFEAFGVRLVDALLAAAEEFFRVAGPAEVLERARLWAYPAWLQAAITGSRVPE